MQMEQKQKHKQQPIVRYEGWDWMALDWVVSASQTSFDSASAPTFFFHTQKAGTVSEQCGQIKTERFVQLGLPLAERNFPEVQKLVGG